MKNIKYLILPLIAFISLSAKAQLYSIHPLLVEETIEAGKSKDIQVKVTNRTQKKLEGYTIKLEEFIYDNKKQAANYKADNKEKNPQSLIPFSKLTTTVFDIAPRETKVLNLNVTVPKDMKGSGYLRYTVVQKLPKQEGKGFKIPIRQDLTGIVLVRIKGTEEKKYNLEDLSYNNNKVAFSIKNQGNTYLKLKANAYILKAGQRTNKIEISSKGQKEFFVFPNKIKSLSFNIDPKLVTTGKIKTQVLVNFYEEKTGYSSSKVMEISK